MSTTLRNCTICALCSTKRAQVIRPKNGQKLCKGCFLEAFEMEVHATISENNLFDCQGERVAIGASGGKDSTVLAAVLKRLNERFNYGVEFVLLSIDEGIHGYRDDSLETVKRNAVQYGMELSIVGYDTLYGWTMDQIVQQVGKKSNCTYCGVFRRQALDRGARNLGIHHVLTGHNADDIAETVLMNFLRGDLPRLGRCTDIVTASPASSMRRSKPLKYAYEKEIVLYAHYLHLDYFSTECIYSPEAFRGSARSLLKGLEKIRPSSILDIVRSGEQLVEFSGSNLGLPERSQRSRLHTDSTRGNNLQANIDNSQLLDRNHDTCENHFATPSSSELTVLQIDSSEDGPISLVPVIPISECSDHKRAYNLKKIQQIGACTICGYMSSQPVCKACVLVDGLNKSRPAIAIHSS